MSHQSCEHKLLCSRLPQSINAILYFCYSRGCIDWLEVLQRTVMRAWSLVTFAGNHTCIISHSVKGMLPQASVLINIQMDSRMHHQPYSNSKLHFGTISVIHKVRKPCYDSERKEECMPFGDHNRSPLRRQPEAHAMTICHRVVVTVKSFWQVARSAEHSIMGTGSAIEDDFTVMVSSSEGIILGGAKPPSLHTSSFSCGAAAEQRMMEPAWESSASIQNHHKYVWLTNHKYLG